MTCACPRARGRDRGRRNKKSGLCPGCLYGAVEGALSMGLSAVCRIVETTDPVELAECFVWEDGLPQQHPHFIGYFMDRF